MAKLLEQLQRAEAASKALEARCVAAEKDHVQRLKALRLAADKAQRKAVEQEREAARAQAAASMAETKLGAALAELITLKADLKGQGEVVARHVKRIASMQAEIEGLTAALASRAAMVNEQDRGRVKTLEALRQSVKELKDQVRSHLTAPPPLRPSAPPNRSP